MCAIKNRVLGCLYGGAFGDAIGATFENRNTPTFRIPDTLSITDDTQLTLATCESILKERSIDPASIAKEFSAVHQSVGIRGIGSSTLMAMNGLFAGGHWASVGASGERRAGNGAAMRIAPLAFVKGADRVLVRDVSRITHRNDEAYAGALAIFLTIDGLRKGEKLERALLLSVAKELPDSKTKDRLEISLDEQFSGAEFADEFGSTGFVADSVPLALLIAVDATDFLEAMEEIISFGGDTDTIASMFGQVFGAAHGVGAIPVELLERLKEREYVDSLSNEFADFVVESNA